MSAEGGAGGAGTLLAHHLAAIYISWHAATWAPHTKYTSYMAVVEFNTLLLMLKKCAPGKLLRLGLGLGLRLGLLTWPRRHSTENRMPWQPLEMILVTSPRKSSPEMPSLAMVVVRAS